MTLPPSVRNVAGAAPPWGPTWCCAIMTRDTNRASDPF